MAVVRTTNSSASILEGGYGLLGLTLLQHMGPEVAQMRSADRVGKHLLLGVERT